MAKTSKGRPLRFLISSALLVGSGLSGCDDVVDEPTHNEPYEEPIANEMQEEEEPAEPVEEVPTDEVLTQAEPEPETNVGRSDDREPAPPPEAE